MSRALRFVAVPIECGACALLAGGAAHAQVILYVDAGATGPAHDGLSWCTAITELQVALGAARKPGSKVIEIRIAQGVYRPDQGDAPSDRFELISGVRLRGGFAGCGAANPNQIDPDTFRSILSGDVNGDDGPDFSNMEDNIGSVVDAFELDETTVLDGFTISGSGGMRVRNSSLIIRNCTFRGNLGGGGGAMSVSAGSPMVGFVTLENCVFNGNRSTKVAGALAVGSGGRVTATGCSFVNNQAAEDAGAIHNDRRGELVLQDCTFENNTADFGNPYNIYGNSRGGAVWNDGGILSMVNCKFVGNSAGEGGALYDRTKQGSTSVIDCTFIDNTASDGGAVHARSEVPAVFSRCTFLDNSAREGGAVYADRADVTFEHCTFSGNSATGIWDGGGAISVHSAVVTALNSVFADNSAVANGGAVLFEGVDECLEGTSGCGTTFVNCTLFGNTAGAIGGGFSLAHEFSKGDVSFTNCIFWNNKDWTGTTEIAQLGLRSRRCEVPVINYSAVQEWSDDYGGVGNIGDDPLFVDAEAGDFHLTAPESPCINAGDPRFVTFAQGNDTDLDGEPRWQQCRVDMGVDETDVYADCDGNGRPDGCDALALGVDDCDANSVPDACEAPQPDCNGNGRGDGCDLTFGTSTDCNTNGVPDECEADCNGNGRFDGCDIADGTSIDCDLNGIPDECEPDCNGNDVVDGCDVRTVYTSRTSPDLSPIGDDFPQRHTFQDLPPAVGDVTFWFTGVGDLAGVEKFTDVIVANTVLGRIFEFTGDACHRKEPGEIDTDEIVVSAELFNSLVQGGKARIDIVASGRVDAGRCCDTFVSVSVEYALAATSDDCNGNGVPDECDLASGASSDCNGNDFPDDCEDCNGNGLADVCDVAAGTSDDCNENNVPDECEDCNTNGFADECDLAAGTSEDCNDSDVPDECELDTDGDGMIDDCDADDDNDGLDDADDNCPLIANPDQADCDRDGIGDVCEDPDEPCIITGPPPGFEVVEVPLGGLDGHWASINNCGQIVTTGRVPEVGAEPELFLYENGQTEQLTFNEHAESTPDINDAGVIVWTRRIGAFGAGGPEQIIRYEDGEEIVFIDNSDGRTPRGPVINNLGHIAWHARREVCGWEIMLFDGENIVVVASDGEDNRGVAINDRTELVWTRTDSCDPNPLTGSTSQIMRYSNGVITPLPSAEPYANSPDINNAGRVVWGGQETLFVWQGADPVELVAGGGPSLNDSGDIAFHFRGNRWGISVYRDGRFYRISKPGDDRSNTGADINEAGEITWTRWGSDIDVNRILMMRRIRTGDMDLDDDVDFDDFALMTNCFTGPVPTDGLCGCRFADIDHDRDVDDDDFSLFLANLTEPPADCNANAVPDLQELWDGTSADCNENFVIDECDIDGGFSQDNNANGVPDECDVPTISSEGSRYLAVTPAPGPDDVALFVTSPDFPCMAKYVDVDGSLVDSRVFQASAAWETVYVFGREIVPGVAYEVRTDFGGAGRSAATRVTTARWGDTVGAFADGVWAPPDGRVEILDITAALDRFRGAPLAPPLEWCDIAPAEPNGVIDITSDVLYIVDAFRGFPYPFDGPPPCP